MIVTALFALALQSAASLPQEPYSASGTNPNWSLTINDGRIAFESPGREPLSIVAPTPQTSDGIVQYHSRQFDVSILRGPPPCDRPDDRRFADAVFVNVGGTEYSGCGGAEVPLDSLDGTSWHFVEIAGEATELTGDILRDDRYAVDFSADSVVGYGGCNRFSFRYARSGDMLTPLQPFGATVGACREPIMSRERRLFQILSQPLRVSRPDRETMLLTGESGAARLRRSRPQN